MEYRCIWLNANRGFLGKLLTKLNSVQRKCVGLYFGDSGIIV
jgi:hypothetical protein